MDVFTVADIDAVCIIAPQAYQFEVVDFRILAPEQAAAPDVRIPQHQPINADIGAICQADCAAALDRVRLR